MRWSFGPLLRLHSLVICVGVLPCNCRSALAKCPSVLLPPSLAPSPSSLQQHAPWVQVAVDEKLQSKEGVPPRWYNAVIPIGLVVFFVLLGLILTGIDSAEADGIDKSVQNIFGNGDPFASLLWATFFVSLLTWGLYRLQYHHNGQVQPFWNKHEDAKPFMTLRGADRRHAVHIRSPEAPCQL